MLREEVLREWTNLKADWVKVGQLIKMSLYESDLPSFPMGVKSSRRSLNLWTEQLVPKLHHHKNQLVKVEAQEELSSSLLLILTGKIEMFQELVTGWKQETEKK